MVGYNIIDILPHIDPACLSYQEWVSVGMALKDAGHTVADWDAWSRRDASRYHPGECEKKWAGFHGASRPVTAGSIVQLARDQGWTPPRNEGYELDWNDEIGGKDDGLVIDKNWLEGMDVREPSQWDPAAQLIRYLELLFEASETVGYVTESWEKDGKYLPTSGHYDRTAGKLIETLGKCDGDIGAVIGDCKPEAGAWIRFNPLDGKGVKNENVTEYRYALVESDSMDIEQQYAIITALELPVAVLVHSGKKSLHAIVHIDAGNYEEYRKRVDYLYATCQKNGLKIDSQNRNPSRLSRMPGIERNGRKQYIVAENIGKESYNAWHEWIESVNDDLPDPESMADVWDNLPKLAPPLIQGVLRKGHKLLLAGPSKAGKSYSLIALCCAIAEGRQWFSWGCAQGKVMYVNLELDRASCLHRFKDVYQALGWQPNNVQNIDIWNLRGKAIPMDKLAPKLIRRAAKKEYVAIVIDPIYKVITGDENSADQMANFCNQFDKVCNELGCAVIYCHHHSKGQQGQKRSMDRASGSGVFARDPDAMLDMIELEITDALRKQEGDKAALEECRQWLNRCVADWEDRVSQDHMCSITAMLATAQGLLSGVTYKALLEAIAAARKAVERRTAWRIEGTLREFPRFDPVNLWFNYPVHLADTVGSLADIDAEGDAPSWRSNFKKKKPKDAAEKDRKVSLETAFQACNMGGQVTVSSLSEYLGVTEKTVRNRLKDHGGYWVEGGTVGEKHE